MRIAMWSGPRNLSTAMMYSFGSRSDFGVWDEPFYAPYLAATGADHPMAEEIKSAHETDPETVANACLDSNFHGKPHFYMKHMPHHMLPNFPMDWTRGCVNIHLIRHPARVVASYAAKRENPTLEDIGFAQQAALYAQIGGLVVDSADIRQNPERMLQALCEEIGLSWDPEMLTWPAGGREEDGIWAQHWYGAIHRSTGFAGAEGPLPELDGEAAELVIQSLPHYDALATKKLTL